MKDIIFHRVNIGGGKIHIHPLNSLLYGYTLLVDNQHSFNIDWK